MPCNVWDEINHGSLHWHHNEPYGASNHQPHHCLFNRLFRRRSRKHQSSALLAFVRRIHLWPVSSSHKEPVTWKMFPFDDVIICNYFQEKGCYTPDFSFLYLPNVRRFLVTGYHSYVFPNCCIWWLSVLAFSLYLPFGRNFIKILNIDKIAQGCV